MKLKQILVTAVVIGLVTVSLYATGCYQPSKTTQIQACGPCQGMADPYGSVCTFIAYSWLAVCDCGSGGCTTDNTLVNGYYIVYQGPNSGWCSNHLCVIYPHVIDPTIPTQEDTAISYNCSP